MGTWSCSVTHRCGTWPGCAAERTCGLEIMNVAGMQQIVLVDGDRSAVIRERESIEDLIRGESLPAWLG